MEEFSNAPLMRLLLYLLMYQLIKRLIMTDKYKNILIAQNLLLLGLVFVFWLMGYSLQKESSQGKKSPIVKDYEKYVEVDEVHLSNIKSKIHAYGRIQAAQTIDLTSEVQGKILSGSVLLKSGQNFKKDELLLRIDDQEIQLGIQAKKSSFLNKVATLLPDMKIDFNENYLVWQRYFESIDIVKPIPDLPYSTNLQERTFLANKNILSDYLSIKGDEERAKKYYIHAPFDGAFTEVFLEKGAVANPGSKIANLIQTKELEIEIPVPADEVRFLSVGSVAVIKNKDKGEAFLGKLVRIGAGLEPTSLTLKALYQLSYDLGTL